ncbi:acyltransferase [Pseudoduganella ginsengisoli]|uniref:Acyltransferase family protein n=1 Tax=Pseudoduganella ginsengisoli TaxID=1462440 RepID=A0A6L6Q8U1_9BURK|nr:acyltransferase [Pseudoduganella ginsengisoli]MTW06197.1 acyltransferase family protein [Pseudoduganella ginsengisoli]
MNKSFSVYLDFVRFFAALAVFVCHLESYPFTDKVVWWRMGAYGGMAVTIFFVLSGYVIAYVTDLREKTAADYYAARIARLYSVVGIALLLTFCFDTIGMAVNPEFYTIKKALWKPPSWQGYLASAFFLNEYQVFGFNGISPGTNGPYWSLSFEATYYVIAGLILFAPRWIGIIASLVILSLAGRTITALLPLWALGFALYHWRSRIQLPKLAWQLMLAVSALLLLAMPVFTKNYLAGKFIVWLPWGAAPFNRNIFEDYITAVLFTANLVAVRNVLSPAMQIPPKVVSAGRWLGAQTFPLYCFHYPAICMFAAISPWKNTTVANAVFVTVCTLAVVALLTPVCDALKDRIRPALVNQWGKMFKAAPRPSGP